ncbi:hypothetical protein OSTOST_14654, partial [Ostertagia ostertagi]
DHHIKVETSDSFKIERPQPKYADGRRTSAPAILWSPANLVDDKKDNELLAAPREARSASPDSGIGLDHPMDSTDLPIDSLPPSTGGFSVPVIPTSPARNALNPTNHTLPPFLWPWINAPYGAILQTGHDYDL